jgi:hypothetical protein
MLPPPRPPLDTLDLLDDSQIIAEQSLAGFHAQAAVVRGLLDVVDQLLGRTEDADRLAWELIEEMARLRALLEAAAFPRRACSPALTETVCDSEPERAAGEQAERGSSVSGIRRVAEMGRVDANHRAAVVFLAHVRADRGDALVDSILLEEPA